MANYISFNPSSYFAPKKYTGTGSTLNVTGVGFQPDLVWLKNRSDSDGHFVYDVLRGATTAIMPNNGDANATYSGLTSFDSDGFTLGTMADMNTNTENFISWNWKAGTTTGKSTTDETITPTDYSLNTAAGISIIRYTGTGTTGYINHGLGVKPNAVIIKQTDSGGDWRCFFVGATSVGYGIRFNSTNGSGSFSWDCNLTANTVQINGGNVNPSGSTFVMYTFANIPGYSHVGTYAGNGDVDGPMIYTGFRPAYVMIKRYGANGNNWEVFDDKRSTSGGTNEIDYSLSLTTSAEDTSSDYDDVDFLANGFKIREDNDDINAGGSSFLYMAFAALPIVSSNSKAGTAY